ncbi:hypothetical protein [Streptomyces sp. NPDC005547]|uniref:hypothetical protein n=1 Tax=Streptomyces sp. NPDC005547 TaxID=3154887 RepID=UPI0033A3F5E6
MDTDRWVAVVGGVAALAGAGAGAGGAIWAAHLTARRQAATDERHWRRQVCRDAYVKFLSAVIPLTETLYAVRDGAEQRRIHGRDLKQLRQDLTSQIRVAREPIIILEIEVPQLVADAASDGFVALLRLADELKAIDGVGPDDEVVLAEDFSERLSAAAKIMDRMRQLAKESLA